MTRRGLKPQTKAAMVAKLQQIAALSPSSSSSISASRSSIVSSVSASIQLDDSSSDESEADAPASSIPHAKGKLRRPKKGSKSPPSLRAFLQTYVPKIHDRYHASANRREMELVISSYLQPTLQPTVQVLEKQIQAKMYDTHSSNTCGNSAHVAYNCAARSHCLLACASAC